MTTPIVFAVPYSPPAPPLSPFKGLQMEWRGWDGSRWDLTGTESSVVLTNKGGRLRGLGMPEHERWSRTAPLVPGSFHLGHQVKDREVHWPVLVYSDQSSQAFIDQERAFWKTMDPDREGIWTVIHPNGERRHLRCRFLDDASYSITSDPIQRGWEIYSINMLADDPYWYGDVVTNGAEAASPVDWMDPSDAPFMTISKGSSLASAKVNNPGDVDADPVWWLHGPCDSASVGFGDRLVDVPFAIVAGKTLVIDTSPTARYAKLVDSPTLSDPIEEQMAFVEAQLPTAENKTKDLGANSNLNGRIPAGGEQQLNVTFDGVGSVRILLTPKYKRAW